MILVDMAKNPPDVTIVEPKEKAKMNKYNGPNCPDCKKLTAEKGYLVLCDYHALDELEHTAWAAQQDYMNAVNKYIEKLQKEKGK